MESDLLFFCTLFLGTNLGQSFGNGRILNTVLGTVSDVVTLPLDLADKKVELTTNLVESGVQHGINIGKMGVAAGGTLSSQGLKGGIDIGKQSIDLAGTVSEIIPGVEFLPVKYVTDGGKAILNIGNNIGQQGITATSELGNQVLDKTKTITRMATGTVANLTSAGTKLTKNAVSTTVNGVANLLNKGVDVVMALVPGNFQAVPEPEPNGIIQSAWSYITSPISSFF